MKYRPLVFAALALACVVVVVGAYVRLHDAGLGCPDWPGCYGHWVGVPEHRHEIERAAEVFPGKPVRVEKAWREMFHRYLAGTLGLFVLAIMVIAWAERARLRRSPLLPTALVILVGLQAALGMWTVTLLLKPVIVTLHLLGGMATLALLTWLAMREIRTRPPAALAERILPWARAGLLIVIAQIALGGWVSANYAALACLDFPTCRGAWVPAMDFHDAFQITRELGATADGSPLGLDALTAIHWTHRVGALVTALYVGTLAFVLLRTNGYAPYGAVLGLVLVLQIMLGIANVMLKLPLPLAVAHNAGAAALLLTLVVLNFALSRTHVPR